MNRSEYQNLYDGYLDFGENLKLSLAAFLKQNGIDYHFIQMRIKTWSSFKGKLERKEYGGSDLIEDICGLRIICFYLDDVKRISDLVEREFNVVNSVDKEIELDAASFGYRSKHYVVTVKNEWLKIPNYQNCDGLKAEIQIRTILMHAWADIEHKLSYKNESGTPKQMRRQFSRLSALIEIADEQFEQIKERKQRYIEEVTPKNGEDFDLDQSLDVDSLQAFLDIYLSERERSQEAVAELLVELASFKFSFRDILDSYKMAQSFLKEASNITRGINADGWAQVGAIRLALRLFNDQYWKWYLSKHPNVPSNQDLDKLREKIKQVA